MKTIIKYVIYVAMSFLIGYVSLLGEEDYIAAFSKTIVQVLVMLLTLYTTISTQLVARLMRYKEQYNARIKDVLEAMKRNFWIELVCVVVTFFLLAASSWLVNTFTSFEFIIKLIINAVVSFSFLYFVIIVVDSSLGLYDLLKDDAEI